MSEWETKKISDIADIISGGTPSRVVPMYWNGEIPWVTPTEITNLEGKKYLADTNEKITKEGLTNSGAQLIPANSLLVTTRASLGMCAVSKMQVTTNQGFKSLAFKKGYSADFYYHLFKTLKNELERRASGTTFLEISGTEFAAAEVPVPDKEEQKAIATVLDTVDEAIQLTQAILDKQDNIKQGLLHDLLTRGVDERGHLRPLPETAPDLYQKTEISLIPKGWNVSPLAEVIVGKINNGVFKKPSAVGSGVPLINVFDLYQDFGIDTMKVERLNLDRRETDRYKVRNGDCFFTRSSLVLSGIAHCNIIRKVTENTVFECHLMRITPNSKKVVPEFLAHWCRSDFSRKFLMSRAKQVTMTTISQPDIEPMPVVLPDLKEQRLIVDILDSEQEKIIAATEEFQKLQNLKSALMQDLLTGRRRITPALIRDVEKLAKAA